MNLLNNSITIIVLEALSTHEGAGGNFTADFTLVYFILVESDL